MYFIYVFFCIKCINRTLFSLVFHHNNNATNNNMLANIVHTLFIWYVHNINRLLREHILQTYYTDIYMRKLVICICWRANCLRIVGRVSEKGEEWVDIAPTDFTEKKTTFFFLNFYILTWILLLLFHTKL